MLLLYAIGVPYIIYTLNRYRTPSGHGLNWTEPKATRRSVGAYVYGGRNFGQHQEDMLWHPDDSLKSVVTRTLPIGEPINMSFPMRSRKCAFGDASYESVPGLAQPLSRLKGF